MPDGCVNCGYLGGLVGNDCGACGRTVGSVISHPDGRGGTIVRGDVWRRGRGRHVAIEGFRRTCGGRTMFYGVEVLVRLVPVRREGGWCGRWTYGRGRVSYSTVPGLLRKFRLAEGGASFEMGVL